MPVQTVIVPVLSVALAMASAAFAAERGRMMQPIVPPDQLAAARALKNPLPETAQVIERGKSLYEGKGSCFTCHGLTGQGDGAAAANLNPAPRNFRHHGMWRHRTEGEIFWVIKNGSPGTGMIGFGGMLSDEEIWAIMRYERSFADGGHGPGMRGGEGRGPRGPGGPADGRGPHRGDMGHDH